MHLLYHFHNVFYVLWHTGQQSCEGWERSKNEQSELKQLLDEEHTQQPVETEESTRSEIHDTGETREWNHRGGGLNWKKNSSA